MKANDFRIEAIALGLALICISAPQPVYAGGDGKGSAVEDSPAKSSAAGGAGSGAKSAPAAPPAAAAKQTGAGESHPKAPKVGGSTAADHNPAVGDQHSTATHQNNSTGSELTGSELTGSQLTGFNVGFGGPSFQGFFTASSFPFFAPDSSDIERVRRRSSPPGEGQTPHPSREAIAPVADTASASPGYGDLDTQLRSAQSDYDAALAGIRVRLNQNATYQQTRARQTEPDSAPTSSSSVGSSVDSGNVDAAKTIAEMESKAVAADPEANAARQKLDEAVLAHNTAERAQAAPHATVSAPQDRD